MPRTPAVSTINISALKQTAVESGSTQPEPAPAEGRVLLQEVGREKPATVKRVLGDIYRQNRMDVKGIRTKKYGIGVEVLGIYVHNDVIYIHTMISNETNISFEVDARQFIVADRKLAKRTAQQQTPLDILRVCNDPTVVRGTSASEPYSPCRSSPSPTTRCSSGRSSNATERGIRRWRFRPKNYWKQNYCNRENKIRCSCIF